MDHSQTTRTRGTSRVHKFLSASVIALFIIASVPVGIFGVGIAQAATDCAPVATRCVGSGQEYTTIQAAVTAAQAGDTVVVFAGTYAGFSTARSGTAGSPITVTRNGTDTVTINAQVRVDHNYITLNGLTINYTDSYEGGASLRVGYSSQLNHITVTNCRFSANGINAFIAIFYADDVLFDSNIVEGPMYFIGLVQSGQRQTVSNNIFRNATDVERIFNVAASNSVWKNNEIYNFNWTGDPRVHSDVWQTIPDGSIAQNNILENNYVHDNDVQLGSIESDASGNNVSNWTWRNNIFANIGTLYLYGANFKFYNNTFYRSGSSNQVAIGLYQSTTNGVGNSSGFDLKNNLFLQDSNEGIVGVSLGNVTWTHSYNFVARTGTYGTVSGWSETGGVNGGNPQFTAPSTNCITTACNFHIGATTAAKDHGTTIASVTVDKDGVTRPQGTAYDMGAYEYASGGGGDTQAPTVSLTAPASGATVSGASITVSATASDNVGVAGVQFKLDGNNLSTEDTTSPYSITWNTTTASNGSHTLTAVARDAAGNTTTSAGVTVTVSNGGGDTQAPSVPTNLTASPISQTQINLSWSASTDNVGVTGYRLYRDGVAIANGNILSYNDIGLTANTTYSYTVEAYDAVGNTSAKASPVSATTGQTQQTGETIWGTTTPTYSYTSDGTPIELGTIFSVTTAGTITGVRLFAAPGESGTHTARLWRGSTLIGGPYTFTAAGAGWISYTLPTPVAVTTGQTYTVSITTGADSTRYYAYRLNAHTTAGSNGLHINYPVNAGVYTYTMNTRPTSAWSASTYYRDVIFTPTPAADTQAPTVPTNLTATATSSTQINLAWSASTDNVSVTGYDIYRGGTLLTSVTGTTYQNTGLTPSTQYSYQVRAKDAAGNTSALTTTVSATTQAPPDTQAPTAPTNLTATPVSGTQINLAWTGSTDNVGVTGYKIYRNTTLLTTVTGTSYNDTAVSVGTAYTYEVSAIDAANNESAHSNQVTASPIPAPTVTLSAMPSSIGAGDSVLINWTTTNTPTSCTASDGWSGSKATTSGNETVTPAQTSTYTLTCVNAGGSTVRSVTVTVGALSALPTISFPDGSFTWTTANADTCTASNGWTGIQALSGSFTFTNPLTSSTYTLTCTGPGGTVQRAVTITTGSTAVASTKFTVGATVTTTNAVNVRDAASTAGTVLGTQAAGAQGTIIGGPVQANGYWWWQVNYASGVDGWSVENWLQ